MKKLLLALLTLTSITALANDYNKNVISCEIQGDVSTLSQPTQVQLPGALKIDYTMVNVLNSKKLLRIEQHGDISLEQPTIKRLRKNKNKFSLDFGRIGTSESKRLLEALGATNVPQLPYGFEIGKVKNKRNCGYYRDELCNYFTTRAQVHFSPDVYDGLSYHLVLSCRIK